MRSGGSRVRNRGKAGGSERDDREPSRGCHPYRGTLRGEVSQSGGGSGQTGDGSNVKSTAQSCAGVARSCGRRADGCLMYGKEVAR